MSGAIIHIILSHSVRYNVLDLMDSFTCSFTEFSPFCSKLYYLTTYKDFNTLTLA